MKKIFYMVFFVFYLSGCQSATNVMTVNSNVKGMVYNSVASQYMSRMTTAKVSEFQSDGNILSYFVESYKFQSGVIQQIVFAIPLNSSESHKKLLGKFLEWNEKSKNRKEQLTKEIGIAKTYNGYSVYTFHSVNQENNYLTICFSATNTSGCSVDGITFDENNVKLIIQDIYDLQRGKFNKLDDSAYN